MYAGWRNWGFPSGWAVKNPMYNDPVQSPGFWQGRRESLAGFPPEPQPTHPSHPPHRPAITDNNQDDDDDEPQVGSIRDLNSHFGNFSTNITSAHGFTHIYTATSIFGRVMWTLIVLGGISAFLWQMEGIVSRYIAFGTVTELTITTEAQLEFPAVTICNLNSLRKSAVERSKYRYVLYVDYLSPLPYYAPCQDGDFECLTVPLCVRDYLKCDGVNHCGDMSDEFGCNYGSCGEGQYKCNAGSDDGYCIASTQVCDRTNNCYDGEDEWDCTCRSSEFKCFEQGGCIRRNLVCDSHSDPDKDPDCVDGSDEENCPTDPDDPETCDGGYSCEDSYPKRCIPVNFLCDGVNDCPNDDDEVKANCESLKPTPPPLPCDPYDEFRCNDGSCIPISYRCDAEPDCKEYEDEMGCGNVRCEAEEELACTNNFQCVPKYVMCDFYPDCAGDNQNDESGCACNGENDAGDRLFTVNCGGSIQYRDDDAWEWDNVELFIKCQGPGDPDPEWAFYRQFDCDGQLTCANLQNNFPQTCTSVFTDCYVTAKGADYKGIVAETTGGDTCVNWNEALPTAYAVNRDNPLIGNHNFCRNPGGYRDRPWCYIVDDDTPGDPLMGEGVHWDYCTVAAKSDTSCHTGITLEVRLEGGTDNTNGRVEVKRGNDWGTVHDSGTWDTSDAVVICKMLGFNSAVSATNTGLPGAAGTAIIISWVDCDGSESTLADCVFKLNEDNAITDLTNDVSVSCSGSSGRKKREVQAEESKEPSRIGKQRAGYGSAGKYRKHVQAQYHEDPIRIRRQAEEYGNREKREAQREELVRLRRRAEYSESAEEREAKKKALIRLMTAASSADPIRMKRQVEEEEEVYSDDLGFEEIVFEDYGAIEGIDLDARTFTCPDTGDVLPLWMVCNNIPDCEGGFDEVYCAKQLCDLGYRPCRFEDQCILTSSECDGFADCHDFGLDEAFCQVEECPRGYWHCPDRPVCIPLYYRCDTVDDCGQDLDEENCVDLDAPAPEADNPFEDENWYEPYLDIINNDAVFTDFQNLFYKENLFHRVKGEDPVDWKSFFTFSQYPDYQDLLDVLHPSKDEIKRLGHQFDEFVLECTFDEAECDIRNFTQFQTDEYGNCFTFNYNPGGDDVYTIKTGPHYGLRLILNVQQDEYISLTGSEAGARVSINPPGIIPLPGEDGINIRPGVSTSIGLRYENITRLGGWYGSCYPEDTKFKLIKNGQIVMSEHEAYDRQVCLQACLHENIMNYCGCSDTILLNGPPCKVTNVTEDTCRQLMHYLQNAQILGCDCEQECHTRTYSKTTSQSKWPSNIYRPHLIRYIHAIQPNSTKDINDRTSIDDNLVRLQVFYEQLNYGTTSEAPAYSIYSMISDTGGTAGLYIGFSIITFIEFAVVLYQLCKRGCCPWQMDEDDDEDDDGRGRAAQRHHPSNIPPQFAKDISYR